MNYTDQSSATQIKPADYLIRPQTIFCIVRQIFFSISFLRFLFISCVWEFFLHVYLYTVCTWCQWRPEEGIRSRGPRLIDGHILCRKQQVLLTLQSLQPQEIKYFLKNNVVVHNYQKAVLRNYKKKILNSLDNTTCPKLNLTNNFLEINKYISAQKSGSQLKCSVLKDGKWISFIPKITIWHPCSSRYPEFSSSPSTLENYDLTLNSSQESFCFALVFYSHPQWLKFTKYTWTLKVIKQSNTS